MHGRGWNRRVRPCRLPVVAARCAAYLLLVGYKILIKMLFNNDRRWAARFCKELFKVKRLILRQSLTVAVVKGCVLSIRNRLQSSAT